MESNLIKTIEEWNKENLIPDGKRYRSKDGKYLSSPTALLRALDPVGQKAMEAIPEFVLNKCRDMGINFEQAILMYELGDMDVQEIADELFGKTKLMFLSFVNVRKKRPELEFVAHDVLVGTHNYFGKIDFIYKDTKKDSYIIVEVKTANGKPRLSHYVQVSMYWNAVNIALKTERKRQIDKLADEYGYTDRNAVPEISTVKTEIWLGVRDTGMFATYNCMKDSLIFDRNIDTVYKECFLLAEAIQDAQIAIEKYNKEEQ